VLGQLPRGRRPYPHLASGGRGSPADGDLVAFARNAAASVGVGLRRTPDPDDATAPPMRLGWAATTDRTVAGLS